MSTENPSASSGGASPTPAPDNAAGNVPGETAGNAAGKAAGNATGTAEKAPGKAPGKDKGSGKALQNMQRFGRSLMLPIAALPAAALLLRLGQDDLLGRFESLATVAQVIGAAGWALF
jgi:hypothetical protein